MMKYIFLTFTIDRVTGAQRYVDNKVRWLKEMGWDVVVFDHHGGLDIKDNIVLDGLKQFKDNRFYELFFPPAYFSKHQRAVLIEKMCSIIGPADDYVVESNSGRLALWGELLSQRLYAKHLMLFVGEHPDIRSREELLFYSYKFDRNELFFISEIIAKTTFVGYRDITDEEASSHRFAASMGVVPQPVSMPEIENLPNADYRILSFGRQKDYFDNMINGICEFAERHKNKRINFVLLGVETLPDRMIELLAEKSNVFYRLIPQVLVVPKAIFECSDVVIATAGCANISFREGAKTISMNVKTRQPLGVMGYTTVNSVTDNNNENNVGSLLELLEKVLVEKCYEGDYLIQRKNSNHGYEFQLSFVNNDRVYWNNIEKISLDPLFHRLILSIILRMNGINKLVSFFNRNRK